jgi:hypothetical protein
MDDSRPFIDVTPEELERALRVWLKTAPPMIWRPYLKMLEVDPKRRDPDDRVDPRDILAIYLAGKFAQARWEARHREPARPPG